MMMYYDYDLIVLGGGFGGLVVVFCVVQYGCWVVMLEFGEFGGICVNVGCVLKKVMWLVVDLVGCIGLVVVMGFDVLLCLVLDWKELVVYCQVYIVNIYVSYFKCLDENKVVCVLCCGCLVDVYIVECSDGVCISVEYILIVIGVYLQCLDILGVVFGLVFDDFFNLCSVLVCVVIVGGGYIVVELVGLLQVLGSWVILLVCGDCLLEWFDVELIVQFVDNLCYQGVQLYFGYCLCELQCDGDVVVVLGYDGFVDGQFDVLFFVIGCCGNSVDFGLEVLGVVVGDKGEVEVDVWQIMVVLSVYVVGDIVGKVGLILVVIVVVCMLMDCLFGGQLQVKMDYENVVSVVFLYFVFGVVGLSEEEVCVRYGDVCVYCSNFCLMLQVLVDGIQCSLFKLVCVGEEECVVGVYLFGEVVDEILQGFVLVVKMGVIKVQFDVIVVIYLILAEEVVLM